MSKLLAVKKAFIVLSLLCFTNNVFSQEQGEDKGLATPLIKDPKLRYGVLENGLTYYIRHNEMPKERAEFYIVHNVGSMQETEDQRGLAHFLEHMAFNGSKHFPSKKGMQDYTESLGMRMGENLNAYTGFDETVYNLKNVPVIRESIIDSCLLILHDWSSFLLLEDEAIEKERGVVREEWRTKSSAQLRLMEQQLPKLFPGNKYGNRIPIGSIDVINNFKREELVSFYKKWYRPDLQAVIIVGDIDVDKVEAKIKKLFSEIPAAVDPVPRELMPVSNNNRPIVSIAKDKEIINMELGFFFKHEKMPFQLKNTFADFLTEYQKSIISLIMSERFSGIVQKADPPFVMAIANDGDYLMSKTKGAWSSIAIVKPAELNRALRALVLETERVKKFGFNEAEYDRARENLLKSHETAYKERDKHENSYFAESYINNFTDGDYIPGIEAEYEIMRQIAPNFPVEGINSYITSIFKESADMKNLVISLTGPDKADVMYPSEEELLIMYIAANKADVTENEEEVISKILIPELPQPGKIVSEKEDPLFGTTLYTLSNGVRVVVKQTEYKDNEIIMTATSPGGATLFKDEKDIWNLKLVNYAIMLGGLGEFSASDLGKAIAGKSVSCSVSLGQSNENVNGYAAPSDLKTLFELIYLQFTGMRIDDEAYDSFKTRIKSQLDNSDLNPMVAFNDTLTELAYNSNPRNSRLKSPDFDKIDYHRMIDMYNERYADASDFIFTFVGNIDTDTIKPLLEQYLAVLPSLNRIEKGDEKQVTPFNKGIKTKHFPKKIETPKSSIGLMYSGEMPYNFKNYLITQLLKQILDMTYTERVREDESATYNVSTNILLYDFPEGRITTQIYYDTNPDLQEKMLGIVKFEFERIAKEGPVEIFFEKSRANIIKSRTEMMQQNDYWLNAIDSYYSRNFDAHTDFDNLINNITIEDIKSFTKQFLDQGNVIEVVMYPEVE